MAPSRSRKPSEAGKSRNKRSENVPGLQLKLKPRKNHVTCTIPVLDNLDYWRGQIRPRYRTQGEYDANHFLHLVTLCHHSEKADLPGILANERLVEILEKHYKDFDIRRAWQKVCNACSEKNKRALIDLEGVILLCAKLIDDPNDKVLWRSSGLLLHSRLESLLGKNKRAGEEVVHSDMVRLNVTPELAASERSLADKPNAALYEKETLRLSPGSLEGFFGPFLRSGMMSTDYRQSERPGGPTSAVSIGRPVSGSGDSILEIITGSVGGKAVRNALGSVDGLRWHLGGELFKWMEKTDSYQSWTEKGDRPPVWVDPKDPAKVGGDQIVTVMVHSQAYQALVNMSRSAGGF